MTSDGTLVRYTWTCPLCGASASSISNEDGQATEGQAANAVASHVRSRDDAVHGPKGRFPADVSPDDALGYVEFERL